MQTATLQDGTEPFTVSVHHSPGNLRLVLFAAGAGGLPERYSTLLNTMPAARWWRRTSNGWPPRSQHRRS